MNVLVVTETEESESIIIGVCDSKNSANKLVEMYYGVDNFKELSFKDIRDSNIECQRVLSVVDTLNIGSNYTVILMYEWFELNK